MNFLMVTQILMLFFVCIVLCMHKQKHKKRRKKTKKEIQELCTGDGYIFISHHCFMLKITRLLWMVKCFLFLPLWLRSCSLFIDPFATSCYKSACTFCARKLQLESDWMKWFFSYLLISSEAFCWQCEELVIGIILWQVIFNRGLILHSLQAPLGVNKIFYFF